MRQRTSACRFQNASQTWHNQMVMKTTVHPWNGKGVVVSDELRLANAIGMPGKLVKLRFRSGQVVVLAVPDPSVEAERPEGPVTDPLHLELLTGAGDAPSWLRPVVIHAVVEARKEPLLAVMRASRWASYSARVAVAPAARVGDRALLEAQLRGVWLVTIDGSGQCEVAVQGERGAVNGSARNLQHRLLDEMVWAAIRGRARAHGRAARCSATA
jgi:hypothetical protein